MFSGIVESKSTLTHAQKRAGTLEVHIKRPSNFNDLKTGDSICVNGVCLTLESCSELDMSFALAAETLQVTGWNENNLIGKEVNLERSLSVTDRIHGHLVTGHVDAMADVIELQTSGESSVVKVAFPQLVARYLWKKGSVTINGVSLTINEVSDNTLSVCLIPETLKRTNLEQLEIGQKVTLEVDNLARGLVRQIELGLLENLGLSKSAHSSLEDCR